MPGDMDVVVRPISAGDVDRVAAYLHRELNPRLSVDGWSRAIIPSWPDEGPNHGFMLLRGDRVVGVNLAFYSTRTVAGERRALCNVAALCVDEEYRPHTVRLLRAILRQPGYDFTDLSPSGNVVELDRRLGFRLLDDATLLVANVPRRSRGVSVLTDPREIGRRLTGEDRRVFEDHRSASAARHLVLTRGGESCYILYRRDRRKGLPLFATVLHVGQPSLFATGYGLVAAHLLRQGAVATLLERRVVDVRPPFSRSVTQNRPKMVKSAALTDADVDYLYSELTCVPW